MAGIGDADLSRLGDTLLELPRRILAKSSVFSGESCGLALEPLEEDCLRWKWGVEADREACGGRVSPFGKVSNVESCESTSISICVSRGLWVMPSRLLGNGSGRTNGASPGISSSLVGTSSCRRRKGKDSGDTVKSCI
jgi:hypothetical protein